MEFKESESFSPMKNNMIEQSSRVYEILTDAGKFKSHYNDLVNNIIDSMNSQCRSYERNSKKSIMVDVYDNVIENIDWSALQNSLATDLKGGKQPKDIGEWVDIGNVDDYHIEQYDIDPIVNMYSNYGEDSVKEYAKYMDEAIDNLNEMRTYIDDFEQDLCNFRSKAVKIILEKNIPLLYNIHFRYVNDLMRKKKNITDKVSIRGVEINLKKSQKEFICSSLKKLIIS